MVIRTCLIFLFCIGAHAFAATDLMPQPLETEAFASGGYSAGELFLTGQPKSKSALEHLQQQGLAVVVNLRTPKEMESQDHPLPNEKAIVESLGMQYVSLPSGGSEHPYSFETVTRLAEIIDATEGRVLLHCASGRRASHLWVAYLVKHKGLSLDDAIELGKQANFGSTPLEAFLDQRIQYELTP